MSSLIERAKSYTPKKRKERVFTQDELELFIALAKSEITLNQAANALNYEHSGTLYVNISKAFTQLVQRGIIEFKPFPTNTKKILCKNCKKEMIVQHDEDRDFCSTDCYSVVQEKIKVARRFILESLFRNRFGNEK